MSSGHDRSRRPGNAPSSWKKSRAVVTGTPDKNYIQGGSKSISPATWTRIRLAFFALGAAVGLAILIPYLLRDHRAVPFWAWSATKYDYQLPPNSMASEDLTLMSHWFGLDGPDHSHRDIEFQEAETTTDLVGDIQTFLSDNKFRGPNGFVILYISAHGVVDAQGRPTLLLPDEKSRGKWFAEGKGTSLEEVLAAITESKGDDCRVLLALDANRIDHEWSMGVVGNGFSEALETLMQNGAGEYPDIFVLNSASPGETAYADPALGGSVFCNFLTRGLAGFADIDGKDGVSVEELTAYLDTEVPAYVQRRFGAIQTPQLWSADEELDTQLCYVSSKSRERADTSREIDTSWLTSRGSELNSVWEQFESASRSHAWFGRPLEWGRIQARIVRLGQLCFAGAAYTDEFHRLAGDIKERLSRAPSTYLPHGPFPLRLQIDVADLNVSRADELTQKEDPSVPLPYGEAAWAIWRQFDRSAARTSRKDLNEWLTRLEDRKRVSASGAGPNRKQWEQPPEIFLLSMIKNFTDWDNPTAHFGQFIKAHDLALHAGAPEDPRAHYFGKSACAPLDADLNAATDHWFIGSSDANDRVNKITARLAAAGDGYDRVIQHQEILSAAWRTRDETLSNLVWLAQWSAFTGDTTESYLELYRVAKSLSDKLDQVTDSAVSGKVDATGIADIANLKQQLDSNHGIDAFVDRVADLVQREPAADPATAREMMISIRIPIVDRSAAKNLREVHNKLIKFLANAAQLEEGVEPSSSGNQTATDEEATVPSVSSPSLASLHDLMSLKASSDLGHPSVLCQRLRELSEQSMPEERNGLAKQDLNYRIAAPLLAYFDSVPPIPEALYEWDFGHSLAWWVERQFAAGWGDGGTSHGSYFASVANRVRRILQEKEETSPLDTLKPFAAVASAQELQAKQLDDAFGRWSDNAYGLNAEFSGSKSIFSTEFAPASGLPLGEATMLDAVTIGSQSRPQFAIHGNASLRVEGNGETTPQVLFRFHLRDGRPSSARTVAWERPTFEPYVVVRRKYESALKVLFVFDCSYSMGRLVKGPEGTTSQYALAANTLITILNDMNRTLKGVDVGLMLYGHRYKAWTGDEERLRNEVVKRRQEANKILSDTHGINSRNDFDVVEEMGPLDGAKIGRVERLLGKHTYTGWTPLYGALLGAQEVMDSQGLVIAITDGANTLAPGESQGAGDDSVPSQLRPGASKDVQTHVLFIEDPGAPASDVAKVNHLRSAFTSEYFHSVDASGKLIAKMRDLLHPIRYSVHADNSKTTSKARLDSPFEFEEALQPREDPFDIRIFRSRDGGEDCKPAKVYLEGRQWFELQYDQEQKRLQFLRDEGYSGATTVDKKWDVKVLDPRRTGDTVDFFVAILPASDQAQKVPQRPAHIWAELTPISTDGRKETPYIFYDRDFDDETDTMDLHRRKTPILRLPASNWPAGYSKCRIDLWFRYDRIRPDVAVKSLALANGQREDLTDHIQGQCPGVRLTATPLVTEQGQSIAVEETHPENSGSFGTYQVMIRCQGGDPLSRLPAVIRRHYYAKEQRIIKHEFRFDDEGNLPKSLELTKKATMTKGAHSYTIEIPVTR